MNEIKIGVIGSANAGKSTLIGVLSNNELDDGRGSVRSKILQHPHEKTTGRTSCVSRHHVQIDGHEKYLTLLDLAGHEKYLKTTLHGLSGHFIDYAIIMVGANMGVLRMTREHLGIVLALKIPFIVVVSKLDIAPENKLNETLEEIQEIIRKKRSPQKNTVLMKTEQDNKEMLEKFTNRNYRQCPIFQVSNKTGKNIDLLKGFLYNLESRFENIKPTENGKNIFRIYNKFKVTGVGLVVSGYVRRGLIKPGNKMFIGPIHGDWKEIVIKSLHDNFRTTIDQLTTGESGCVAIKFTDKKFKINKNSIRKGVVISGMPELFKRFEAYIYVLSSHGTTIRENYQPILNCNTIVQSVRVYDFKEDKKVIRGGEKAIVKFEFLYRPEYIEEGDLFIFREGNLRGLGEIIQIFKD